jgi:ELWxxDGT repeat protein
MPGGRLASGWWRTDANGSAPTKIADGGWDASVSAFCSEGTSFITGDTLAALVLGADAAKVTLLMVKPAGLHRAYVEASLDYGKPTERHVLAVTDGTASGTTILQDGPDAVGLYLTTENGRGFGSTGPRGTGPYELLVTDGTKTGTTTLDATVVVDSLYEAQRRGGVAANEKLYFWAEDSAHGAEPWVTDFTAAGTHLLADIRPGSDGSLVKTLNGQNDDAFLAAGIFAAGGQVFVVADDGTSGKQIFGAQVGSSSHPGGAAEDGGVEGTSTHDGGITGGRDDAQPDENAETPPNASGTTTSTGCGCSTLASHSTTWFYGAAGIVSVGLLRRRRRAR